MPGVTHWNHPQFHAYFPSGNAYTNVIADALNAALGCVGFSWVRRQEDLHFSINFMIISFDSYHSLEIQSSWRGTGNNRFGLVGQSSQPARTVYDR